MATLTLRPNAAGDATQYMAQSPANGVADHWDKVDEVIPDEDSTYLYILTGSYWDLFNIPDHTTETDTIVSVKVTIRCRNYSADGSCYARPIIKTGGTEYKNATPNRPTTTWTNYSYQWDTNPKTGLPWTWADIDALQIGVYLSSGSGPGTKRCTQVYAEIEYGAPTVTTQAVTSIQPTTAIGNGNITAIGLAPVTQHGVCWNTSGSPTVSDDKTEEGEASTGAFTSAMTGLTPETLYYCRAYATNSIGTSYGGEVTFTTPKKYKGNPHVDQLIYQHVERMRP